MPDLAIAAAITGAAELGGAKLASNANKKAAKTQAASTDKALEYEKERDAEERAYRDRADLAAKAQWDAREAQAAPYRQASAGLLGSEMQRLGFSLPSSSMSAPSLIAKKSTLADLAGLGTQIAPPIDNATDDPYNTRFATPATGRRVNIPQMSLQDIMQGMQQGRIS